MGGAVRHLLPHSEAHDADVRRFESFGVCGDQRYYVLSALSGSAQLGPAQARREFGAFPASALFHDGLCAIDFAWLSAIPRAREQEDLALPREEGEPLDLLASLRGDTEDY